MDTATRAVHLLARQAIGADDSVPSDTCATNNEYDGRLGLRIAAIFIIWFGSTMGACFPVFARSNPYFSVPSWTFFVAKFFGSGVIIATAFIHLLAPAHEALTNECLTGAITEYSWVEGIALMTIFLMFFVELMVMRYGEVGAGHVHGHAHDHTATGGTTDQHKLETAEDISISDSTSQPQTTSLATGNSPATYERRMSVHQPGYDHLGHAREHNDIENATSPFSFEDYSAQLTSIFILEFGVIFHSVFIGLTLAVSGSEFITLFIVLVFHQTFEGLGLGSRIAVIPWPESKRWTPYLLGIAYGLSTPIAIAVGLGVRNTYPPEGRTTLIVNGVFDSISAGILIYTGLVELMAHEFMFSSEMRKAKISVVLSAIGLMALGAGLMALLGKWA